MTITSQPRQFNPLARVLHWTMAAMVLSMLCIGVAMVVSLGSYHTLISIHRPLGIAILVLVVVRFINRQLSSLPPFPPTMSHLERRVAKTSEFLMYGLMLGLPLVGWGMLSAARYPIVPMDRSICRLSFRRTWCCTRYYGPRIPCSPTFST